MRKVFTRAGRLAAAWACAAAMAMAVAACGGDEPENGHEGGGDGQTETTPAGNMNANPASNPYMRRLEVPRLSNDEASEFIPHTTQENGRTVVSFSVEQATDVRHPRWVAFTFDATTAKDAGVGRTGKFKADPALGSSLQSNNDDFGTGGNDGIDRGHLCASEDRQYSRKANEQTFYFTNMSPQYSAFNQQIWAALEGVVQDWGRTYNNGTDTLFVAKGGTISRGMTLSEPGTNVMPRYYYMALLSKKWNAANQQFQYRAIAFCLEQRKAAYQRPYRFSEFAMTIDQLEEETGIDFFCNLPDKVEDNVEQLLNLSAWPGLQ